MASLTVVTSCRWDL